MNLLLMALLGVIFAGGFIAGAAWVWGISMRAIDEWEAELDDDPRGFPTP